MINLDWTGLSRLPRDCQWTGLEPAGGPTDCHSQPWFENERGRRRPVPFGSRSGLASSSYFFGFFLSAFAPPSRPGLVTGLRTLSSRRRRSVWSLALARGECGCGIHPTLLSLVTCIRQLYPSTRRRVSLATLRADPRFLPELLLHSPLAEKGQ